MEICGAISFLVVLLGQGPVISLLVQWLKRLPLIQSNPLAAVAVLNALAAVATNVVWCGVDLAQLLTQLAAGFAASVATYELGKTIGVVAKPNPVDPPFERE